VVPPRMENEMDRFTQVQIARAQEMERVYQEQQREAQQRMVAAVALENMERAKRQAEEAARQRQLAQEQHNRAQGFFDNWR
jgi:hypothetical protein